MFSTILSENVPRLGDDCDASNFIRIDFSDIRKEEDEKMFTYQRISR